MKFGTVATSQFSNALSSSTNIPKLAPYWDDQATGTNGSVKYLLTGSAPNRQLVVEWFTVVPRSTTGAATARYQAVLTETTNTVQYIYGGVPAGNSYSVGLRGPGGTTDFLSVNTVTNTASTTANDSQTAAVTTGTQYAFTPPACAAPAPTVSNVTTNSAQVSFATVSGDTYTVTTSPATTSQTVSASPVTLSGLAFNTTYTVNVVRSCAGGAPSSSSTATFTTLAVANDNPSGAIAIPITADCTSPTSGTNAGATTTTTASGYANPGCGAAASPKDVFYTFTAAASGPTATAVQINITGNPAGQVRVFSSTAGATGPFNQVACSAGATNNTVAPNFLVTGLTASTTYYVFVSGYGSADTQGAFTLCVTTPPSCSAPSAVAAGSVTANSASVSFTAGTGNTGYTVTCTPTGGAAQTATGTASPIALSGLTQGTTYSVTVTGSCAGGATATSSPAVTFTTVTPAPANDNLSGAIAIPITADCTSPVSGSCAALTCVGGNDDLTGTCANIRASSVSFPSAAGTQYYFFVQGFNAAVSFGLSVTCTLPTCNAPTALATNTVTQTTANVTFTAGLRARFSWRAPGTTPPMPLIPTTAPPRR